MGIIFAILAALMVFFQFAPVVTSAAITFFKRKTIKSRFNFFVFLSLMALGLSSILYALYGAVFVFYTTDNFDSPQSDIFNLTFIVSPIIAIVSFIFQLSLIKHWKKYEG